MPVAATSSIPEVLNPDQVFQKKFPYKLILTNLAGVETSGALLLRNSIPEPQTPKSSRYGLFLRRPSEGTDFRRSLPHGKRLSRGRLPQDRIVPQLVPQLGVTHRLRRAVKTDGKLY